MHEFIVLSRAISNENTSIYLAKAKGFRRMSHTLYLIYKRKRDALAVEYIPYFLFLQINLDYIMPPIPGCPAGMAGAFSSGLSVIKHSVVKNKPAIEDAFSSATRATFAGSMIPALRISS